jgi:BASS family bile acid:Na+ symporter
MNLHDFIEALPGWLVFLFVLVNMFGLGLSLTVSQILTPLKSVSVVTRALIANFVIVPLAAFGLAHLLELEHSRAIMLILISCSAGDPFTTKLTQSARGDKAFSLAIMTLLSVGTIIFMPLALPVLLPGVSVSPVEIIKPLVILILIPLIIGLICRKIFLSFASRWAPRMDLLGSIIIISAVILFAIVHFSDIVNSFGSHAVGACILLVLIASAAGYFLGGPGQQRKGDLLVNTGYRGVSAAMAVGIKNFPGNQNIFTVAIIMVLASVLILVPLASTWLRTRNVKVIKM